MSKPPKKLRGRPAFDDRGNAIWKFAGRSEAEIKTGSVRALAEGLSLETPSQKDPTLDPYNQPTAQDKEKTRRRSLDDMRRLSEKMKREHEEFVRSLRSGTPTPGTSLPGQTRGMRLRLRFDDHELLVDERRASISIGRSEDHDVVMAGQKVSRLHARIELSCNKFVLIDLSANGTFVQTPDGEILRIRRGSCQLQGRGLLGFGHRPKQGSPHTIQYACDQV